MFNTAEAKTFLEKMNKIIVFKNYFSEDDIKRLKDLADKKGSLFRKNVGNGERMSFDGKKKSRFTTYKFANFDSESKSLVKEVLKDEMKHNANEVYFLNIMSDEELYEWKSKEESFFTIFSVALTKSIVTIEGKPYKLNPGDAITFPLNKMHGVPSIGKRQLFFAHILLGGIED